MWRGAIMWATGRTKADREDRRSGGNVTAFKSDRTMRLSGKTARKWAKRIRAGKAHGARIRNRPAR